MKFAASGWVVPAGHGVAAQALCFQHGALRHALKRRCRTGLAVEVGHQRCQLVVDIPGESLSQRARIDPAGLHHGRSVFLVRQGEQEMFQSRVFVTSLAGMGDGPMQRQFE